MGQSEFGSGAGGPVPADQWIVSIMEEGKSHIEHYFQNKGKRMQKVSAELRKQKENRGFYDPNVVSIGPYHHGRPELREGERLKTSMAYEFIEKTGRSAEEIYSRVEEVTSQARECYLEGSTDAFDDTAFACMMFLDGCFVLHLIYTYVDFHRGSLVISKLDSLVFRLLHADVILMENQLPFMVLRRLMATSHQAGKGDELLENYIAQIYAWCYSASNPSLDSYKKQEPMHFLGLVRERYVTRGVNGPRRPSWSCCFKVDCCTRRKEDSLMPELVRSALSYSFRSATELRARGVHFKSSSTFYLTDLSFASLLGSGQLTLPQVEVSSLTRYICLNMMAYELSSLLEPEVCNFVYFMNSLINGADDVALLRSRNIIHNFLGTDEEVAKVFNTMAASAPPVLTGNFKDVSDQVQKHYNSRARTWMAQALHDHFSSPWTAVAFFAAIFVIALTITQTYFQVFPPTGR